MTLRSLVFAVLAWAAATVGHAATTGVAGQVTDPAGLPLPGVVVTLSTVANSAAEPREIASLVTDERGSYTVDVPPGQYALTAELSGFQLARQLVTVKTEVATIDVRLALASFQDSVTITADASTASLLAAPQPNAPVTVTRTVINSAMLPNSRYEDVLTLMPNVVRGPDNRISIGGTPASTGSLVVNGFNETDPAGGLPGVVVPIDAVDAVDVHTGGYGADLGRATSGVTTIQTRSGANQFHTSADSIFPRFLFENGTVHGVEYWEPNVGASGPIIKGRLFFEEAVSYRFDRNRFTTLAGPQHNTYNQPLVWSQLDGTVSSRQHVRFALAFDEQHTDHAHITAFTPADSVPTLAEDGWSAMLSDDLTLGKTTALDLKASWLQTASSVEPTGSGPYAMGHQLASGGYFDDQTRKGRRVEAGATLSVMPTERQVLKLGVTVDRAVLKMSDTPSPVSLLRSDGSVSHSISFLPLAAARVATIEGAAFVQDTWSPRPWVVLDGGLRYDRVSATGSDTVSPRMAWTVKHADNRTSVSGSIGLFVDKLVLSALAFPSFPTRVLDDRDSAGFPSRFQPILNVVEGSLTVPFATRWDIGVDRIFSRGWQAHLRYQERHGANELIVQPSSSDAGTQALALSSTGRSAERALETTVGFRRSDLGHEFYISYVRSSARGDLNTFDSVEGLTKDPFVQANAIGALPSEVPHRLLAWGLLRLPGSITFAPFVSVRSGFAYSAIDDDWLYVGNRDGLRLPVFGSLDISVTRVVDLPRQLPQARVGLKLYNIVSVHSEREVQPDVVSPEFGTRYDPVPRDFSVVCVFLLGRH